MAKGDGIVKLLKEPSEDVGEYNDVRSAELPSRVSGECLDCLRFCFVRVVRALLRFGAEISGSSPSAALALSSAAIS